LFLKLTGLVGLPDRLVLLPRGRVLFVELKRPGQKPRPAQQRWIKKLRGLGFSVEVVTTRQQLGHLIATSFAPASTS
jgi:hypothetical protein